jgi:hypothetical protein
MGRHNVEVKTERDADGHITRIGASWTETRPGLEQLLISIGVASLFAVVGGGLWALAVKNMHPVLECGLFGLIAAIWLLFGTPGNQRALYFRADGRMETPFGIYHRSSLPAIGGHYRNIVSIEARAQHDQPQVEGGWDRMYEVILLSKGGDLICLSRDLQEWVALKAAAQLNRALIELRREDGNRDTSGWQLAS